MRERICVVSSSRDSAQQRSLDRTCSSPPISCVTLASSGSQLMLTCCCANRHHRPSTAFSYDPRLPECKGQCSSGRLVLHSSNLHCVTGKSNRIDHQWSPLLLLTFYLEWKSAVADRNRDWSYTRLSWVALLRARRPGNRIPGRARLSEPAQVAPGAHQASSNEYKKNNKRLKVWEV